MFSYFPHNEALHKELSHLEARSVSSELHEIKYPNAAEFPLIIPANHTLFTYRAEAHTSNLSGYRNLSLKQERAAGETVKPILARCSQLFITKARECLCPQQVEEYETL